MANRLGDPLKAQLLHLFLTAQVADIALNFLFEFIDFVHF
jgi:hypothetical protein